jgi:hypothetical protein
MITKQQCIEWIAALRSGEYEQGSYALKRENKGKSSYCCLGVAQKLFDIKSSNNTLLYIQTHENGQVLYIYPFLSRDIQGVLARMNDHKYSFAEIADHIEKEILPTLEE